jgi:drug/metabolite transporter (DMT)-like permease
MVYRNGMLLENQDSYNKIQKLLNTPEMCEAHNKEVFAKMNVAYALALFQLSTIVSVFLGVNIFKEKDLRRKLIASFVMIFGAIIIILNKL